MRNLIIYASFFFLGWVFSTLYLEKEYVYSTKIKVVRDTITSTKVDTLYRTKIIPQDIVVIDTIYVAMDTHDSIALPKTMKHYGEENRYDAWISGYEPSLDSIKVYNKTETKYVTETKTIEKNVSRLSIYPYVGLFSQDNKIGERIGISIATKRGLYIGADVGYSNKNITYGCNVGFKIK